MIPVMEDREIRSVDAAWSQVGKINKAIAEAKSRSSFDRRKAAFGQAQSLVPALQQFLDKFDQRRAQWQLLHGSAPTIHGRTLLLWNVLDKIKTDLRTLRKVLNPPGVS